MTLPLRSSDPTVARSGAAAPARGASAGALRKMLVERFPGSVLLPERVVPPIPTGLEALDAILPGGGLPRGRVVVWQSAAGGATALVRAAAGGLLARGERVAWIDGARRLGPHWVDGPLVVRPAAPELALRAAEILLRSGGFALVVLGGVEPDQTAMLRLSRMAHEGGGGFVAITSRTLGASLRLTSRYLLAQYSGPRNPFGERALIDTVAVEIEARAPGWQSRTVLRIPVAPCDFRMALEPGLPDRRGVTGEPAGRISGRPGGSPRVGPSRRRHRRRLEA